MSVCISKCYNCEWEKYVADVCVVKSLKGSSVMLAVHMHNFESISAAMEIVHIKPCCL